MDIKNCIDPKITMLKVSELLPDEEQPRDYFDQDAMDELKASVEANGIITPLLYRVDGDKKFIVSGERRHKVATELNLPEVPAQLVLRDYQIVALSENMQRNSLTAMEEALGLWYLEDKLGMSRAQLMEKFGKAESTISEMLKPAELPEDIRKAALSSAFWSRNLLLKLAKIKNEAKQQAAFEKMKAVIDEKEAEKKLKTENRRAGIKEEKDSDKPKSVPNPDKKIAVFKSQVTKLHDRVKKELEKGWQAKDRNKLKKDLQALVATINEFLEGKTDDKEQTEKKAD